MDTLKSRMTYGRMLRGLGFLLVGAMCLGKIETWAQGKSETVAKGESIFEAQKCGFCHRIRGKGGTIANDLSEVGTERDAPWLLAFLKNPKAVMPKAKMMPFKGTAGELEALVAYLSSLK
jgi:cytochrome c2